MTETYSLAATGRPADQTPNVVNNVKIGDTAGLVGSQQLAMSTGAQILCKNPDGSQSWYTIDAERSLPGAVVLKEV